MYSLLDADQFKDQIANCLSGLSNFLAVETEWKGMDFALQSQVEQPIHPSSYNRPSIFAPLCIDKPMASLRYLEFREKQFVKARCFEDALRVAKWIDELLVANAPHDSYALSSFHA